MNSTDAAHTISTCRSWFSKYGLPNQIVTDNGGQFTANDFKLFCEKNGLKHILTAPFHQSSNGQAERFVQTIKKGLKMNNIELGDEQKKLDNYLFAYRITPSTVTGKSPAELFVGRKLRSRLDNLKPTEFHVHRCDGPRDFSVGNRVFARKYGGAEKWMAGVITRKLGNSLYEIRSDEKVYRRHVDQILRNYTKTDIVGEEDTDEYLEYDVTRKTLERPQFIREGRYRKSYPKRVRKPVNRYGME